MFDKEAALRQIEKNRIENKILKVKIEFWGKLTDDDEMGYFDAYASNVLEGITEASNATDAEMAIIRHYRAKIECLEKQLHIITFGRGLLL